MATNNAINVQGPTPLFHAYSTVIQTFSSGVSGTVQFENKNFDTTSSFDSSTGIFSAPTSGYYQFNINVVDGLYLSYNPGSGTVMALSLTAGSGSYPVGTSCFSYLVYLNASDSAYVVCTPPPAGTTTLTITAGGPSWNAFLVFAV